MMKGIAQSQRNHAWHTKHTQRIAARRASHNARVLNMTSGLSSFNLADHKWRMAQAREKSRTIGFIDRIKLGLTKLFKKFTRLTTHHTANA